MSIDVSIIIVHTYEKTKLRQTLRGLRRAAPKISYEVIIVDNNPAAGVEDMLKKEFPDTRYRALEKNFGFGGGMNRGIEIAKGRYILIFNPDIIVEPGSLEAMVQYMDNHPSVGVCGPRLKNPDGSLQYSCYRIPTPLIPIARRTPLGRMEFAKQKVDHYMMMNENHDEEMEVDALIGAALFTRADLLRKIGLFDERFFMYYEDNDLCRRVWEEGSKVIYLPDAQMMHYHRRASADGGLFSQLTSRFAWIQIASFIKYWLKYRKKPNPRSV
jgi:GT2 family glycosyltransferase